MTKLYNAYDLYRCKKESVEEKVCEFIREKMSDHTFYDDQHIQYEHTVEYATELLEGLGLDVESVGYDSYYNRKPNIDASFSPYDFLNSDSFISSKRYEFNNKIRESVKKNEESPYKVEGLKERLEEFYKERIEELKKTSLPFMVIEGASKELNEALRFVELVYEELGDATFELKLYANADNEYFELNIVTDNTAYDTLAFLFKVCPDKSEIAEYELEFLVAGDDSALIDENASEIWQIADDYIASKVEIINDAYSEVLLKIETKILEAFEGADDYLASDDYIKDLIDNDEDLYSEYLFDENGNYICSVDDMEYDEVKNAYVLNEYYYVSEIAKSA